MHVHELRLGPRYCVGQGIIQVYELGLRPGHCLWSGHRHFDGIHSPLCLGMNVSLTEQKCWNQL